MDKSKEFHLFFILNIGLPILFFGADYLYRIIGFSTAFLLFFGFIIFAANIYRARKASYYRRAYALLGILNLIALIGYSDPWILSGGLRLGLFWMKTYVIPPYWQHYVDGNEYFKIQRMMSRY